MEKIKSFVFQYYITESNHCCATMYKAALVSRGRMVTDNECLHLAGFSGGMSVGETCGALTGGIAAIGALINKGDEASFHLAKDATAEYYNRFRTEIGSVICNGNKKVYRRQAGMRCLTLVEKAADILDEVLEKYGA